MLTNISIKSIGIILGEGLLSTIEIFIFTLILSIPLGMIVYFARKSKLKILSMIIRIYISIMRGTPLMLQLMFLRFGPYYLFGLPSPDIFLTVIVGFVLNYAAYFAEIYRSGFNSIDVGQYEAAKLLGFNKKKCFFIVILPQVLRTILPTITNEVITLLKDTSLAMAISYVELLQASKALAAKESSMIPYIVVGVVYYVLNYIVAFIMEKLEKKMDY